MATNTSTPIQNEAVNKDRPVYISYAGNSDEKPEWEHIADGVEMLKKALEAANIEYCERGDDDDAQVTEFEEQIGESDVVVLVFSDRYFQTPHCMHEFVEIKKSLKKDPDKKLLCIKSGTFNLADVNYILKVERFWGDKRQEYGEIDFHQMRQHSEQEVAANDNNFYIDDIRRLYTFFSAMNYLNMAVVDWKAFVDDIADYFEKNPQTKSKTKKKKLPLSIRLFLWGIVTTIVLILVVVSYAEYFIDAPEFVIENPGYSQNDYYEEGGVITRIRVFDDKTFLHFSFPKNFKDTIPFSNDTSKIILVEKYHDVTLDEHQLLSIKADPFSKEKDKNDSSITGNNAATTDYILMFNSIASIEQSTLDLMDGDKGVYNIRVPAKHLITVEHPEYDKGIDNLYIYKIEVDKNETKLYFRLDNKSGKDSVIYASDNFYIFANGEKYYLNDASGIPVYPNRTKIAKGASINFAMMFPQIPYDTETLHFICGNDGIFGLKIQRENIKEVLHPQPSNKLRNYLITKIEANKGETVLHFRYFKRPGDSNKWHSQLNSYIIAGHTKYEMKGSSGLPPESDSTATRLDFALIFPPIPGDTKKIDCILHEDFNKKDFIGFYGLKLNK